MKYRTLGLLAGIAAPLMLAGSAHAELVGLVVESKPNEFGLLVCNVYAEFDSPGDLLFGVGGGPPFVSTVQVVGGTFYQHPAGNDTPPNPSLFEFLPSLRYDTFVTIGVKSFNRQDPGVPEGQLQDGLVLSIGWPGFQPDALVIDEDHFYGAPSGLPQTDPFNPDFVAGDGRLLIGQFATADGIGFTGELQLNYNPGFVQEVASFEHIAPQGCLTIESEQIECNPNGTTFTYTVDATESCSGLSSTYSFTGSTGAAGQDMCFTVLVNDAAGAPCCTSQVCVTIPDCSNPAVPGDLDGDGNVGAADLLQLIAAWGACPACDECAGDLDADCAVGVIDMLALLENWG